MGGVVNIVSIKPENTFEGDFKVGISEHNMWNANVNLYLSAIFHNIPEKI
jgi:outer membrane receptor for ferrienterochelin and colicin